MADTERILKELPKDKELPKEMVRAFQRIEATVNRGNAPNSVADEEQELRERELRRKKIQERLTLAATVLFSVLILVAALYSRTDMAGDAATGAAGGQEAAGGGGGDSKVDCTDSRLKFTRYCMANSKDKTEANWDGLSRGDKSPFAIHNKESKK